MKEEKCIILDFLPNGYPGRRHSEPVAQAIGHNFSILELVPKENINLKAEEEVYVGEGKRDKIRYIKSQLDYNNLTNFAQSLIPEIVEKIVHEEEARFLDFFNRATIITPRLHQLQLLPGVGKKHVLSIFDERKRKPFETFKELSERVKLSQPEKIVIKRILQEMTGNEKYNVFVPKRRKPDSY